jgi:nitrous oxidase accessory protein
MNAVLMDEKVMFNDPHPLAAAKGNNHFILIAAVGLAAVLILLKGRHLLCITFGRNGRKT